MAGLHRSFHEISRPSPKTRRLSCRSCGPAPDEIAVVSASLRGPAGNSAFRHPASPARQRWPAHSLDDEPPRPPPEARTGPRLGRRRPAASFRGAGNSRRRGVAAGNLFRPPAIPPPGPGFAGCPCAPCGGVFLTKPAPKRDVEGPFVRSVLLAGGKRGCLGAMARRGTIAVPPRLRGGQPEASVPLRSAPPRTFHSPDLALGQNRDAAWMGISWDRLAISPR